MSQDENSNAKIKISRKTSIHISLSPECKKKIIALADENIRTPSQQCEFIIKLWFDAQTKEHA